MCFLWTKSCSCTSRACLKLLPRGVTKIGFRAVVGILIKGWAKLSGEALGYFANGNLKYSSTQKIMSLQKWHLLTQQMQGSFCTSWCADANHSEPGLIGFASGSPAGTYQESGTCHLPQLCWVCFLISEYPLAPPYHVIHKLIALWSPSAGCTWCLPQTLCSHYSRKIQASQNTVQCSIPKRWARA